MSLRGLAWSLKNRVNKLPGGYSLFRKLTTARGEGKVYKIWFGPMKGFKWSRYNSLPFWYHLGLWEPQATALIGEHLHPGVTFYDVGANAGYHTIYAARAVGPAGRVVAIEPDPDTAAVLREQVALNALGNVVILEAAVSSESGSATFQRGVNTLTSALGASGGEPFTVRTVTLDELADMYGPPALIKMDVEGGEQQALLGGEQLFTSVCKPVILLSTHGEDLHVWCQRWLADHDYHLAPTPGMEHMLVGVS